MNEEFKRWKTLVQEERTARSTSSVQQIEKKNIKMKRSQEDNNKKLKNRSNIPSLVCTPQNSASKIFFKIN